MGQNQSATATATEPDAPPKTLAARDLGAVASLIRQGGARRIVVLTGAGISTAAGIPDFRSPTTGLYANLARLGLPYAEAVFDLDYFAHKPGPFYTLARELYPGRFRPTVSHAFVALLARRGLLRILFTQNIDCLERAAGVPADRIVEAHGSFATQRCIACKAAYPDERMREHVERGQPPRCEQAGCGGLVKPDIVFFGEQLPASFFENRDAPATADLMLVLGTSLTVAPFSYLPMLAPPGVPRVLFNKEQVGDLGTRPDDVLYLGDCDSGVRKLADELGWRQELETMWRDVVGEQEADRQLRSVTQRDVGMEEEMARLVERVEDNLVLSASDGAKQRDSDVEQVGDGDKQEGGPGEDTAERSKEMDRQTPKEEPASESERGSAKVPSPGGSSPEITEATPAGASHVSGSPTHADEDQQSSDTKPPST